MFADVRQVQELTLPWQIDYTGFDPFSATNPLSGGHWWSNGIGRTRACVRAAGTASARK